MWSGVAMVIVLLVGFQIAGFSPPPSPHDTAAQIAAIFRAHPDRIRLGLVLTMFGSALLGPFVAVTTVQMKRIEGPHSPLAYTQLALGALLAIEFIIPVGVLEAAAFHPGMSPATLHALDDVGWLLFVGAPSTAIVETIVIGVVILQDRRPQPVFPRWGAYASFICAALYIPGGLIVFFKTGPLAWNGAVAWWVGLSAFGVWLVLMTVLELRAIAAQQLEQQADGNDDGASRLDTLSAEVASLREQLQRVIASR